MPQHPNAAAPLCRRLEDLTLGLRSMRTQWNRLLPLKAVPLQAPQAASTRPTGWRLLQPPPPPDASRRGSLLRPPGARERMLGSAAAGKQHKRQELSGGGGGKRSGAERQPKAAQVVVSVGDRVQARDRYGDWYDAKVTNERGEGANREVKVHFVGWSRTRDEWVGGDKLRTATPRLANRGVRGMA